MSRSANGFCQGDCGAVRTSLIPRPFTLRLAVHLVAIAEEVGRRGVVRERVDDLLGRPVGGRALGHVEVEDAPAMVGEHDEDEEHTQTSGGHREEIDGDEVPDVVGEERAPCLGRWSAPLREQPRDGALGNVNAELQQLPVDSGSTPERIGRGHTGDQRLDLGVDGRAAPGGPGGELAPVLAEAAALPAQDGGGRHDDQGLLPPGPDVGERNPQETIRRTQLGPACRSPIHGELVAQGEVLDRELTMTAEEEREEPKQVEQERDHRAEIVVESGPPDQPLARRPKFRRRTAAPDSAATSQVQTGAS